MGCGLRSANSRLISLLRETSDTQRLSILHEEAKAGDETLADLFQREGEPEKVEVHDLNPGGNTFLGGALGRSAAGPWSAQVRLYYPKTSRKLYVLQRRANEPWRVVRVEVASNLPPYQRIDSVDGYREYLQRFPDDPAEDVTAAQNRIRELEDQQRQVEAQGKAIARMEDFVRHHPKPGTTAAYEDYLKKIHPDDLARATALERLDALRYEPYKAKGTRAARREFVTRYPDSASAHRLNEEEILDEKGAASFTDAVRAVEELGSATSVGLNFGEYSRRLVDARIRLDQALSEAQDRVPVTANQTLREAILDYQEALGCGTSRLRTFPWRVTMVVTRMMSDLLISSGGSTRVLLQSGAVPGRSHPGCGSLR
jgi:hypothetical protein